jgi:rhodanese-related sulfurtransferase
VQPQAAFERRPDLEIVDVREPEEWSAGHIDGARNIPLAELAHRADELGKGRTIMTVCRTGSRSGRAIQLLRSLDVDADHLEGGLKAWSDLGLPLTTPAGGPGVVAPTGVRHRDHAHGVHEEHGDHGHADRGRNQVGTAAADRVLGLLAAVQEHFGEREPTEKEARAFFEQLLAAEGRTPTEIDELLS